MSEAFYSFCYVTEFSGGDHETQYNRAFEKWPSSVRQFLVERILDEWKLQLFIVILLTQRKLLWIRKA